MESYGVMQFYKQLGQEIQENRKLAGMSRRALAQKLGLTYQQMYKYEVGQNKLAAHYLSQIAGHLQMPVAAFFDEVRAERKIVAEITFREI
ncbi:MAG: helix-turn-helix domain-containing protein [Alphaproteobacteria bacterium]|nr:helix-turn-helix domain-containing protein [Alphaproteobacteria bacterium]